jgi:hypothetical protein
MIGSRGAWYSGTRHNGLRNATRRLRASVTMLICAKPIVSAAFRLELNAQFSKPGQRAQNFCDTVEGKSKREGWRGHSVKSIMPGEMRRRSSKTKLGRFFNAGADEAPWRSEDVRG